MVLTSIVMNDRKSRGVESRAREWVSGRVWKVWWVSGDAIDSEVDLCTYSTCPCALAGGVECRCGCECECDVEGRGREEGDDEGC